MKLCHRLDCGKQLIRKEDEPIWNFNKRIYCDKRCAAVVSNRNRKGIKKPRLHKHVQPIMICTADVLAAGVSYKAGSVEFEKLAMLYQK